MGGGTLRSSVGGGPAELTHQSPRRGASQLRRNSHREAVAWAHCGRRNWSCRPWVRANTGLSTRCTACAPASTSTPPWLQPRMPPPRRRPPHQRSFATCDRLLRSAPTTATWRERGGVQCMNFGPSRLSHGPIGGTGRTTCGYNTLYPRTCENESECIRGTTVLRLKACRCSYSCPSTCPCPCLVRL